MTWISMYIKVLKEKRKEEYKFFLRLQCIVLILLAVVPCMMEWALLPASYKQRSERLQSESEWVVRRESQPDRPGRVVSLLIRSGVAPNGKLIEKKKTFGKIWWTFPPSDSAFELELQGCNFETIIYSCCGCYECIRQPTYSGGRSSGSYSSHLYTLGEHEPVEFDWDVLWYLWCPMI